MPVEDDWKMSGKRSAFNKVTYCFITRAEWSLVQANCLYAKSKLKFLKSYRCGLKVRIMVKFSLPVERL